MISNISKHSAKVNPLLLKNLQRLYLIRARVFHNRELQAQNIDEVFEVLNSYTDGKGISILKKFDDLFEFKQHKAFPEQQYELLNTSYADAIYITSVEEARNLIKEIKELISTFEQLEAKVDSNLSKIARANGPLIDMKVKKMYNNWKTYLTPFVEYLEADIQKLQKIPLGSNLDTQNSKVKELIQSSHENKILEEINKEFQSNFKPAEDRIVALSQMSPIVELSGTLNNLASVAMKMANDVRFLSSGPRSGYGELAIPENEPGSSIMPGKVNPTQCESLTMLSAQVLGNHVAVSIANSAALFESNGFKPLIANNTLRSLRLLTDGLKSFRTNCAVGIELIEVRIKENLNKLI
jgi:fumarate hydratase, class II